jgi:hypothetical protein
MWKPPLEFCRALTPLFAIGGLVSRYMLYGYLGLMLLNWLVVACSYKIEVESRRELLFVPLQYSLWPFFMIVPYCAAHWHFMLRHPVAWRRPSRTRASILTTPAADPVALSTARLMQPGSPFELITASDRSTPPVFRHAPASLDAVYQKAARSASLVCLHFGGRDFKYGEIFSEANAVVRNLHRHHGSRVGERIALILPNCPQWWVAFVAITSMGAVAVLIDPRWPPSQVVNALQLDRASRTPSLTLP